MAINILNSPKKLVVILFLATVLITGGVFFYYYINQEKASETKVTETKEQRERRRMGRRGEGMNEEEIANECGDKPAGEYIQYLFDNRKSFNFKNMFDDKTYTIKWEITGPEEKLKILQEHIEQMGCLLSKGVTPRRWDPAFVAEQKVKKYVKTKVDIENNILKVEKKAENQCAYEVIRLHAQIVEGFFTKGRDEARQAHSVESIVDICKKEGIDIK